MKRLLAHWSTKCIAMHVIQPIATDVAWSVCVCVLYTLVSHTKMAEPIEMLFGIWTHGRGALGPKEPCV